MASYDDADDQARSREESRAGTRKRKKVGAVCRGAAGAACGAEGAAFVVEARSGFLFLHNSVSQQRSICEAT